MQNPSLDDIIAQYLTAVESGEHPERERLMANHPQFAEQLREFFADLDQMNRAVLEKLDGTQAFTAPIKDGNQLSTQNLENASRLVGKQSGGSKRIGHYKLLQRIGIGGMGEVWMAEQEKPVRRRVALKLIKAGMDTDQVVARFEAERQALAMMDHQNIAKVLDAGTTEDGRPYFVMELVQGISITQYCDQNKLSVNDRLNLFLPVCKAVQHAHQKGIIHRDLKPSNILVTLYDGRPVPKVIDFGLAKALQHRAKLTDKTLFTEFGQVVGTLQYMSPEQAEMNALDIDTRTDVYALGVLLYELLTGSTPIDKETLAKNAVYKVLETIREQDPPRPSARLSSSGNAIAGISQQRQIDPRKLGEILRGDLDWIVMKALEKDRTRRYETANGFAADVQKYIEGDVVEARPPSTAYRFQKFIRKNRGLVAALATIGILLLVATVVSTGFGIIASIAREAASQSAKESEKARLSAVEESENAKRQTERAVTAEAKATNESVQAVIARDQAIDNGSFANFQLSRAKWREGNVSLAKRFLWSIPESRRGYEWHVSNYEYEGSDATLYTGTRITDIAASGDFTKVLVCTRRGIGHANATKRSWEHTDNRRVGEVVSGDGAYCANWNEGNYVVRIERLDSNTSFVELVGHNDDVVCVEFDQIGKCVATASNDGTLRVWDLTSARETAQVNIGLDEVGYRNMGLKVRFSPDGASIACNANQGVINVFDTKTGTKTLSLISKDSVIDAAANCIEFSLDGSLLLTSSSYSNHRVIIWDLVSGEQRGSFQGHSEEIACISVNPDGATIATGSWDGTIKIWDCKSKKCLNTLFGHTDQVTELRHSADGSQLISSSNDDSIKIWNLRTGNRASEVTTASDDASITYVCVSPDSNQVAVSTSDYRLRTYDLRTYTVIMDVQLDFLTTRLEYTSDGSLIAAVGDYKSHLIAIVDTATGARKSMISEQDENFYSVAFSPDSKLLVSVSSGKTIRVWDVMTGKQLRSLSLGPLGYTHFIRFSPDGNKLVAASNSEFVFWDTKSWSSKTEKFHYPRANCFCFSPDGTKLAFDLSSEIEVWDLGSTECLQVLRGHRGDIRSIAFNIDGSRLFSTDSIGDVRIWDPIHGRDLLSTFDQNSINTSKLTTSTSTGFVAISPDGMHLLRETEKGSLEHWNFNEQPNIGIFPIQGRASLSTMKSDGMLCAYLSDNKVIVLNLESGKRLGALDFLPGYGGEELRFSSEPNELLVGKFHFEDEKNYKQIFQRWNYVSGDVADTDEEYVRLHSSPAGFDSRFLVSSSSDVLTVFDQQFNVEQGSIGHKRSRPNQDYLWHGKQARLAESTEDWFAAAFHRSWQLKSDPNAAYPHELLRSDALHLNSADFALLKLQLSSTLQNEKRITLLEAKEVASDLWKLVSREAINGTGEQMSQEPDLHSLLELAGSQHEDGTCLLSLGASYFRKGEYGKAIPSLQKALSCFNVTGYVLQRSHTLAFLALSNRMHRDLVEAEKYRDMFDAAMEKTQCNENPDNLRLREEIEDVFTKQK